MIENLLGGKIKSCASPLKVHLSEEEDNQLLQLKNKREIPQRVTERAEMVRLNNHGISVAEIAKYMKKSPHTVRASIHRYSQQGLEGLWEAPGRGRKPGWTLAELEFLEDCLKSEPRTDNTQQLAEKLATQRSVELSADRIRRLLKKRGGDGKEHVNFNPHAQTSSSSRQNRQT